jgi:hypothetical protein
MEEITMSTTVAAQITRQGLLVPQSAFREWLEQEIEVIREPQRIIIQPKPVTHTERERVLQVLETAGLLLPAEPPPPPRQPLSPQEVDELRQKFSLGQPLSEIVIEERAEQW